MTAHSKLMTARMQLLNTPLKKTGHNKFAGYNYFELGDFLPEIQKIFAGLGLCGIVSYGIDIATLTITDMEDGTTLTITSPMSEANLKGTHPVQNLGAVQTYLRRYLWVTALEIVENDVLDATTGSVEPAKAKAPAPAAKPAAAPTGTAPAKMAGKEGEWQLKVSAKPDTDIEAWAGIVKQATEIMLSAVATKEDVLCVFKNNRNIYDTLKIESPNTHAELMDVFTKKKSEHAA
jgi:hypothetical protein